MRIDLYRGYSCVAHIIITTLQHLDVQAYSYKNMCIINDYPTQSCTTLLRLFLLTI